MATSFLPLLLILSILIVASSTCPCETLFYFSATTTTTYYPSNSLNPNPNHPNSAQIANSQYITLIFITASPRFRSRHFDRFNELSRSLRSESPVELHSSVSSSVRDRTMDILSVVGALLFGVGCGAVTAAVMFSLWSLFNPRHVDFDELSSSSDDDDDYDDVAKIGYVAIPAQGKLIDDDLAKEVVCLLEFRSRD